MRHVLVAVLAAVVTQWDITHARGLALLHPVNGARIVSDGVCLILRVAMRSQDGMRICFRIDSDNSTGMDSCHGSRFIWYTNDGAENSTFSHTIPLAHGNHTVQATLEGPDYYAEAGASFELVPFHHQRNAAHASSQPRVFDVFEFDDEWEMLWVRLHELEDVVHQHILIEGGRAFTGLKKPLRFVEEQVRHKEAFARFSGKIIHVVVSAENMGGDGISPEVREERQRDIGVIQGLLRAGVEDNDMILISDIDEIPRMESLSAIRRVWADLTLPLFLQLDWYVYSLDWYAKNGWGVVESRGEAPVILKPSSLKIDLVPGKYEAVPSQLTASQWRRLVFCPTWRQSTARILGKTLAYSVFFSAGWHFQSFGGIEAIAHKMRTRAYSSTYNTDFFQDPDRIARLVAQGLHYLDLQRTQAGSNGSPFELTSRSELDVPKVVERVMRNDTSLLPSESVSLADTFCALAAFDQKHYNQEALQQDAAEARRIEAKLTGLDITTAFACLSRTELWVEIDCGGTRDQIDVLCEAAQLTSEACDMAEFRIQNSCQGISKVITLTVDLDLDPSRDFAETTDSKVALQVHRCKEGLDCHLLELEVDVRGNEDHAQRQRRLQDQVGHQLTSEELSSLASQLNTAYPVRRPVQPASVCSNLLV